MQVCAAGEREAGELERQVRCGRGDRAPAVGAERDPDGCGVEHEQRRQQASGESCCARSDSHGMTRAQRSVPAAYVALWSAIRAASAVVWSTPPKPNPSARRASSLSPVAMTMRAVAATMHAAARAHAVAAVAIEIAVDWRCAAAAFTVASAGSGPWRRRRAGLASDGGLLAACKGVVVGDEDKLFAAPAGELAQRADGHAMLRRDRARGEHLARRVPAAARSRVGRGRPRARAASPGSSRRCGSRGRGSRSRWSSWCRSRRSRVRAPRTPG